MVTCPRFYMVGRKSVAVGPSIGAEKAGRRGLPAGPSRSAAVGPWPLHWAEASLRTQGAELIPPGGHWAFESSRWGREKSARSVGSVVVGPGLPACLRSVSNCPAESAQDGTRRPQGFESFL